MADRGGASWLDVRSGRTVWLVRAASVDDWPAAPPWTSERFALFVATDREIEVHALAGRAIEQGLAMVSAWGPGCREIEESFDDAIVGDGSTEETVDNVIVTTSHPDAPLDVALGFFLWFVPARDHIPLCTAWVVFAIGGAGELVVDAMRRRAG